MWARLTMMYGLSKTPNFSSVVLITVDGRNISGAPILIPLIICSSLPSWLEWKTLISTLPVSAALALLAYSSVVMAKREPGKPTWPSLSVMVCAIDSRIHGPTKVRIRTPKNIRFICFSPFRFFSHKTGELTSDEGMIRTSSGLTKWASPVFRSCLFKNAFSPAGVEHATAAEARHRPGNLCGSAAVFFDPIDHFFDKLGGKHAVAAHS